MFAAVQYDPARYRSVACSCKLAISQSAMYSGPDVFHVFGEAQVSAAGRASSRQSAGPRSPRRSFYAASTSDLLAERKGRTEQSRGAEAEDGPLCDLLGQVTALLTQVHEILG